MKKSRYNCTWQPMTPTNPDGYIVNRHVIKKELIKKMAKLLIERQYNNFHPPIKNKSTKLK